MRSHITLGLGIAVALASLGLLPWLALQEARRQAFDATSDMTQAYARAVLHRAERTSEQVDAAIARLQALGGDPCSPPALALMRELDLTSTYLQAVGVVRDGIMECSSLGHTPIALGSLSLRTSRGYGIYPRVKIAASEVSPLMAVERAGFAGLVHRDLPLDIATSIPGVSLAILHMEAGARTAPELARGFVSREWIGVLGNRQQASFVDSGRLVSVVRSSRYLIVGVASIPSEYLDERSAAIAWRLVPPAAVAGLAIAAAALALARQRRSISAALRLGLRRDEFYLLYQPIVELASGRCIGVEALLRWKRPDGDEIGPDLFIPVAEHTGIITKLTERVFELVEADAGSYLAAHPDFHVAINLSASDLRSTTVVTLLDGFLQRSGARTSNVKVEITERSFLDLTSARRVLSALHARGVEVELDDFGTGYSSLSYLESLELDILKIDRSFIEAIGTGAPTSQVVGHIIAMAGTLKLRMIAEGVETEAQALFLKEKSVQYAQGWLFGKPMAFQQAVHNTALVGDASLA